jgi:hypothetical protein
VEEASDELFRLALDDRLLPGHELDLALVLPAWTMLGSRHPHAFEYDAIVTTLCRECG